MKDQVVIIFITVPSLETGKQIARVLVEKKLAACVNIIPAVNSIYTWEGQIQDDMEALLMVKTRGELFESQLIPAILQIHPYELPEIIALPVQMGLPAYLDWIERVTLESDNRPEKS